MVSYGLSITEEASPIKKLASVSRRHSLESFNVCITVFGVKRENSFDCKVVLQTGNNAPSIQLSLVFNRFRRSISSGLEVAEGSLLTRNGASAESAARGHRRPDMTSNTGYNDRGSC
jgi:hypothetical protein